MSLNIVVLQGNVTRDPDLTYTAGGMPVIRFGIAVNKYRKNKETGDWIKRTDFFDVTQLGDSAERSAEYVLKGNEVFVHGELQQDRWETPEGQKRSMVKVLASQVIAHKDIKAKRSSNEDSAEEYYA